MANVHLAAGDPDVHTFVPHPAARIGTTATIENVLCFPAHGINFNNLHGLIT